MEPSAKPPAPDRATDRTSDRTADGTADGTTDRLDALLGPRTVWVGPAWTGGQYSLWRVAMGLVLLVELTGLPLAASSLRGLLLDPEVIVGLGVVASAMIIVGRYDGLAAAGLALMLVVAASRSVFGEDLIAGGALLSLLVLLHALTPPAPYGSWDARGRPDPGGGWLYPVMTFALAWMTLTLVSSVALLDVVIPVAGMLERLTGGAAGFSAWGLLLPPMLVLSLGVFALVRELRPWIWALFAGLWVTAMGFGAEGGLLTWGLLVVITFDPGWIRPRAGSGPATVFFDGHCGLCHRTVRFGLAEDRTGTALRFAPLQGLTFQRASAQLSGELPDSIVVVTAEALLLTRSDAVLHIAARLGGLWRLLAALGRAVPRPLRDGLYDGIAGVRRRVFAEPPTLCPIVPPDLADRFLA